MILAWDSETPFSSAICAPDWRSACETFDILRPAMLYSFFVQSEAVWLYPSEFCDEGSMGPRSNKASLIGESCDGSGWGCCIGPANNETMIIKVMETHNHMIALSPIRRC